MVATLDDLLELMRRLRDPEQGCPWDRAQTPRTLTKYTLEEAYEVADVIERGALTELPSELGDLLFQVVFYAQIGSETGQFTFAGVVDAIYQKLLRRHPHVFGDAQFGSTAELSSAWEAAKAEERNARGSATSELDDVPLALPALTRAFKLQKRAARVGFDWPTAAPVIAKIREELDELTDAMNSGIAADITDELGDLLFAVVNLARHLQVDPESAARAANEKFARRFRYIEAELARNGRALDDTPLAKLDELWERAKRAGL